MKDFWAAYEALSKEAASVIEKQRNLLQDVYDGAHEADGRSDVSIIDTAIVRDIEEFLKHPSE